MIKDFKKTAIIASDKNISYHELLLRIERYASASNTAPGMKTVIVGENREGWIYAFFSVWNNRGIPVPVDASSTPDDIAYILTDCQPSCIWTTAEKRSLVDKAQQIAGTDIAVHMIDDYEREPLEDAVPSEQEWESGQSVAVIIYTSGTTGSPKGVMLSYDNLQANLYGVCDDIPFFNPSRRTMILLPVHHILPLMGSIIAPILTGGGVAICPSMSGPDIMQTLQRGKISIFIGVPRLWQTLYNGIKAKIDAHLLTRLLFKLCQKAGSRRLSRLVFSSVHKKMGGHIDVCVCGGAALDPEIGRGLAALGLEVYEGYGMTETAPIIAFTRPGDYIPGCCGLPLQAVECRIIDGEICVKGPNVMLGYYNRPEETAQVIDRNGYLHTGDLARLDEKGRIYITGRTKEIIVLSNGKNVQPNEIEYKLERFETIVKEAAVMQDGDMLRAIVVLQPAWEAGRTDSELEQALKHEVLEPYNQSVANYKKVMNITVYHGDLPRTKLEKLQRYKLRDILDGSRRDGETAAVETVDVTADMPWHEEYIILKDYIEREKKLEVKPSSHIELDLAFDSLDRVSLQGFIEQTFGIEVNADTMASYKDIAALASHVHDTKTHTDVEEADWHTMLVGQTTSASLPTASPTHRYLARLFRFMLRRHNSLKIHGIENIPAEGPVILAPNHQSFLDGPMTMAGISWEHIDDYYFYATENHVHNALLRHLASRHNIILMERRALKTSIMKLAAVLRQQKNIVIFPEGTRSRTAEPGQFKRTFAILSKDLDVPIIPVCISGAFEAMPRGRHIPTRHPISITYLPPVMPSAEDTYDDIVNKVRDSIFQGL
ncbi:MAG: AMP-binding protein [Prevotella sp.]